jgi:hypothetical protein
MSFRFRLRSALVTHQGARLAASLSATALSPSRDADGNKDAPMIKTFSLSALFFMGLGLACVTHVGLPF